MAPLVLGYWDIRGRAQAIRNLLAYVGVEYEDKRYSHGRGPVPSRDEWLADKYKLGLDFPNLPYLIDGEVRISQSFAIMRYLGRKHGLMPKDEDTERRVDMIELKVMHLLRRVAVLCYDKYYSEDKRHKFLVDEADTLRQLEAYMIKYGPFCAGISVTYVDFLLQEALEDVKFLGPISFPKNYTFLVKYSERVAALPGLKEYLSSDRFKAWPICSAFARALGPRQTPPTDG
ncbi:glutathione S-transferase Mu 2-like [Dermacentor silvarum]|uniref:glutathione S-transferase Mu 2-like n=1 Tax=Dermacentor silvarum TaxID=543639 RepID=UPI0018983C1A|nr:glutathione S-transferase Mu 2-like [Dermacentor silvarum]